MEQSPFEHNIERFSAVQPTVAYMLPYHDSSNVIRCRTSLDEPNLQKIDANGHYALHSPIGALNEANVWFSKLTLEGVEVLYVVGVGLGYAYEAAKTWLHDDCKRQLVFLEDDLSVLYHLFETPLASALLEDPQATIRYSKDLTDDKQLSDWLCWDFVSKPIYVTALPSYMRYRTELVTELGNKLGFDHHRLNEAVEEYLDYGVSYFRNFYANVLSLHESYLGDGLFGQFANVPAVICGAGPSLQHALPLLGQLNGRALIFAGGSAINALNAAGQQPHFGAGVDPNSPQYQRYITQSAYEVPFFYRLRLNHQALQLLHGPRLYLTGSGGYQTAALFEAALGLEGEELDEGHNIVNFCTSIACALGCNPIIFVGLDLAYTGMKAYAPGVVHQDSVDEQHIVTNSGIDRAAVMRTDVHGKPIYTLWKWIAESEWLSQFAAEHPDVTFLNCTGAGLGIAKVENREFARVIEEMALKQYDLEGMIWAAIQQSKLPEDTQDRLREVWEELDASLGRCVEKLGTMLAELQSLWNQINGDPNIESELKTGLMAVTELELEEEVAFLHVLNMFNEVFIRAFNRDLRQLKASNTSRQLQQLKQIELQTRRYAFLKEAARLNQEMMRDAVKESS